MYKSVENYCRRKNITWEWETESLHFVSPKGTVFANDSRHRFIEEPQYMKATEIISVIQITEAPAHYEEW